jgi:hypothetical protein
LFGLERSGCCVVTVDDGAVQSKRVVFGHVLLFGAGDGVVVLHDAHRLPQRTQVLPPLLFQVRQHAQLLANLHANFSISEPLCIPSVNSTSRQQHNFLFVLLTCCFVSFQKFFPKTYRHSTTQKKTRKNMSSCVFEFALYRDGNLIDGFLGQKDFSF